MKKFIKNKILPEKRYKKYMKNGKCGCCDNIGGYKDVISPNFNTYEVFNGDVVCADCIPLFNSEYRKKSFYITDQEAKTIKQNEFFDILHNIQLPCVLSFTDSNKKHRLFRAKISYDIEHICVVLDDGYLYLDLTKDLEILDIINNFYKNNKVSKEWILNFSYPVGAMKKYNFREFQELERVVSPLRGSEKLRCLLAFCNK